MISIRPDVPFVRVSFALVALFVVITATAAPVRERDAMPRVIRDTSSGFEMTFWIDAAEAFRSDGSLNEAAFSPDQIPVMQDLLSTRAVDGCIPVGNYYVSYLNPPDTSTLAAVANASEFIFEGVVVGRSYGFRGAEPGQLLRIDPLRTLSGTGRAATYYVFIPVGEFTAGPFRLCKTDDRYATPPDLGERTIVAALRNAVFGEFILTLDETTVFPITSSQKVRLPERFETGTLQEQGEFERVVTRHNSGKVQK